MVQFFNLLNKFYSFLRFDVPEEPNSLLLIIKLKYVSKKTHLNPKIKLIVKSFSLKRL